MSCHCRRCCSPTGDQITAEGAYRDNVSNRYVNAATGRVLAGLMEGRRPLRILELGAGIGGTTADLLPLLAGGHVDYRFTDVSWYFLDTARRRFAGHPFLSYSLFDINGDLTGQGVPPASQDVVLGANVAHNAVHVGRFLNGVRELIAPGGVLMLIASCREHYLAMTSMQFLMSARPGAEQPGRTDVRAGTDRVFLTREGGGRGTGTATIVVEGAAWAGHAGNPHSRHGTAIALRRVLQTRRIRQ